MRSVVQVSKEHRGHKINPRSIGIFFEDINFSCDGGINANVINNYSFDGVYFPPKRKSGWKIRYGIGKSRVER